MESNTAEILEPSAISAVIENLKGLKLTVKYERTEDGGIFGECVEFPEAFELGSDIHDCNMKLVRTMKEWAEALVSDFGRWSIGRENEVPYLLKILLSSEEELLSCLS